MTTVAEKVEIKEAPMAPAPPQPIVRREHNLEVSVVVPPGKAYKSTVLEYVTTGLGSVGNIVLCGITVIFLQTEAKQAVKAGFSPSGGAQTTDEVCMDPEGLYSFSNPDSYGRKEVVSMTPPSDYSVQLRPIPSDRVIMNFHVSNGTDQNLTILFKILETGVRKSRVTLK